MTSWEFARLSGVMNNRSHRLAGLIWRRTGGEQENLIPYWAPDMESPMVQSQIEAAVEEQATRCVREMWAQLELRGGEGWELVQMQGWDFWFKRPA